MKACGCLRIKPSIIAYRITAASRKSSSSYCDPITCQRNTDCLFALAMMSHETAKQASLPVMAGALTSTEASAEKQKGCQIQATSIDGSASGLRVVMAR
eukprot:3939247-Rhodomonas_salina.1